MARRATFISQLRERSKDVLVLDSGNALYGSGAPDQQSAGRAVTLAMAAMGYDAMALGGRDLKLGAAFLRARMAEATFPILSANVIAVESGEQFAQPSTIVERAGYRIGIVGLTGPIGPIETREPGDVALLVQDPFQAALSHIQWTIDHADLVIVLSNMGQALDELLASRVPGIGVVLGGGESMIMPPTRYDTTGPIMAQAGSRGQLIGLLELEIGSDGELRAFAGKPYILSDKYADNQDIVDLLLSIGP